MPGETNLRPNQLDVIRKQSEAFLNNSKGGVLVMDGLDYLVTHNDFEGVFNLVQSLKDLASVSESIIILSVGQSTLEETEMKSLEREVDDVL
jgi:archaellum biogenesis ATPase FlaH